MREREREKQKESLPNQRPKKLKRYKGKGQKKERRGGGIKGGLSLFIKIIFSKHNLQKIHYYN